MKVECVPANNFRIELGSTFASRDINGLACFEDRRQLAWQGVSLELRYRFLDRHTAPFGLTFAVENHLNRIDEATAAIVRNYGTELRLAFDRELVTNFAVAALNLIYQPEWTRFLGATEQESTIGAAFGVMARGLPGLFVGVEARCLSESAGI